MVLLDQQQTLFARPGKKILEGEGSSPRRENSSRRKGNFFFRITVRGQTMSVTRESKERS